MAQVDPDSAEGDHDDAGRNQNIQHQKGNYQPEHQPVVRAGALVLQCLLQQEVLALPASPPIIVGDIDSP